MRRRAGLRFVPALLALVWLAPAQAQVEDPQVVAKAEADLDFDLAAAVTLHDDGVAPDVVAADGIYTAELSFPAAADTTTARTFQYVVIPPQGDLTTAVGAQDGPMALWFPDGAARTVTVRYATAADPSEPATAACTDPATILSCLGWAPAPSVSDDWNAPSLGTAAGSFQSLVGAADWDAQPTLTGLDASDAFAFLASAPVDALWEASAPGSAPRLGPDGWWFTAPPAIRTGQPVQAPAWRVVRLELLRERGMIRALADDAGIVTPLITEVVLDPAAPFVELYNPAAVPLSLEGVLLGDAPAYAQLGGTPPAVDPGDFLVGFPAGATVGPGAYATVALNAGFEAAYGLAPDFELSSLPPAYAGSVGAAPALLPEGEFLSLVSWSPGAALAADLDVVVWGAPAAGEEAPVKTGLTVAGAAYGEDAATVNASPAPAGTVLARRDLSEGGERRGAGYNGVYNATEDARHDETDEPLSQTWAVAAVATPGGPAADFTFIVTGTVTDASSGAPLEGAVVEADGGRSATTAADGTYSLTLPEGDLALTARLGGYLDGTAQVALQADRVVDFALEPFAGYRVSGRVEREGGTPLEGAEVVLEGPGGPQTVRSAAGGTFTFSGVDPGSHTVTATRAGFHPDSAQVEVTGGDVGGVVLVLVPVPVGYDVSGRVVDAVSGEAVAGAVLEIAEQALTATTDGSGAFVFRLVPNGGWQLTAAATGYAAQSVRVDVQDAPVTGLRIALVPAADALTLRGRVRVEGMALPIAGAEVSLAADGTVHGATTDLQGAYVLGGLAAGTYALTVSAPSYVAQSEPAFELTQSTERDFELTRQPGTGFTLSGVVRLSDRDEGGWAGSTVRIEGARSVELKTGSGGAYDVQDLPPAVYRVTASRGGYTSASLSVTVSGDTVQDFVLTPPAPGEDGGGCGCAASGGGSGGRGWALLGLVMLGLGRRRVSGRRAAR